MSLKDIIDQSGGRIELIDATPSFKNRCPECNRVFDLTNKTDAAEWAYGHDCEV